MEEEKKSEQRMILETKAFLPKQKKCRICGKFLLNTLNSQNKVYFFPCNQSTLWSHQTFLSSASASWNKLEKLMLLFLLNEITALLIVI